MDDRNIQDHSLDESTDVHPQHFDEEGYVVGHPHHEGLTQADVEAADERLGARGPLEETDEFGSTPRLIRHQE